MSTPYDHHEREPGITGANFSVPLPDTGEGLRDNLNIHLFDAIESTLIETDGYDTPAALASQLDYASALAKIGYPNRSEIHFRKAIEQIELGRGSRKQGAISESVELVPPTKFSRDQASWYGRAAKKIAEAGFVQLADETLERSHDSLTISRGIEVEQDLETTPNPFEDRNRESRDSDASIELVRILIELEQYDTAASMLSNTHPSTINFPKFLTMAKSLATHYKDIGHDSEAEAYEASINDLIEEIKTSLEDNLRVLGDENGLFALPYEGVSNLFEAVAEYEIDADFTELLELIKQKIDHGKEEEDLQNYSRYTWLAELHHLAGDKDKAFEILQKVIAFQHRRKLDVVEEGEEPNMEAQEWAFEAIGRSFATIGAFENSEALRENLPADKQTYIIHEELKYAIKQEDLELIKEAAARLERNLLLRMEEDEVKMQPELINYMGLDLLSAYDKLEDSYSLTRWFNSFMSIQELGAFGEVPGETLDEFIWSAYKNLDISQAFRTLKVVSGGEIIKFLVRMMEDINLTEDLKEDLARLGSINDEVIRYIATFA